MKISAGLLFAGHCLGAALPASQTTAAAPAIPTPSLTNASSPRVMAQLNPDPEFDFVLKTFLSLSETGGAGTAEVLRAASQIKPGDFESFYSEFKFLADQMLVMAQNSTSKCSVSRRDAYFRASSYYRAADFFLHGNQSDPRIYALWDCQLDAFNQAASLLDIPAENINVSTNHGFYVPVRFFKAAASNESRPTILIGTGFDASQEDTYHEFCTRALDRGWNCATYEGPGQPVVRRQQGKGFEPDWWNVVTPVTDYLLSRPDVDKDQMSLMGISFGGQLTPLAVSQEHRYQTVVAVDGLYDMANLIISQLPPFAENPFHAGNRSGFDEVMNEIRLDPETSTLFRWSIDQGLFAWNTESPYDWMTSFQQFSLANRTDSIRGPIFVGQGQDDDLTTEDPLLLVEALGNRAHYHLFKTELGAGEHCQIGAEAQLAQVVFDFIDDAMAQ